MKPATTVTFTAEDETVTTLVEGKDYKLSYKNNTTIGKKTPTVTVTGIGKFKGKRDCSFEITRKDLGTVNLLIDDKIYKNKANNYTTKVTLTDINGKKLSAGKDYNKTLEYTYVNDTKVLVKGETITRTAGSMVDKSDIIPANTLINIKVTAKEGSGYSGTVTGSYKIVPTNLASAKVVIKAQTYTGRPINLIEEDIKITVKGQTLTSSDYEIVSYSNNINKGTAKVTIRGTGNYGGLKTQSFKIKSKGFIWWWRK